MRSQPAQRLRPFDQQALVLAADIALGAVRADRREAEHRVEIEAVQRAGVVAHPQVALVEQRLHGEAAWPSAVAAPARAPEPAVGRDQRDAGRVSASSNSAWTKCEAERRAPRATAWMLWLRSAMSVIGRLWK